MGLDGDLYRIVLVLHILCAIVGFGGVLLNGLYAAQAKARKGPEGLAISQANFLVSKVAQYFIYGVFVFGVLLVPLSDEAWEFEQAWVWLAMALYLVALGISHGLLRPTVERIIGLQEQLVAMGPPPAGATGGPPPQVLQLEEQGKRAGMFAAALQLLFVVILVLMVFKPGA
jgi:uncharacterized membrane protein